MKISLCKKRKAKPDFNNLGFGNYFSDHMIVMDFKDGKWSDIEIRPYEAFQLMPSTCVFHYGQAIFEGMKAYKNKEGKVNLFRPHDNFERMNKSAQRLCMPTVDVDKVLSALKQLVVLEKDWIPTEKGTALYIRPTMIATGKTLGVKPSDSYKFFVFLSPVGSYYSNGLKPIKILVEQHFVRATVGGTGEAKCAGNYAATMLASDRAANEGYDQVLWLDAERKSYVEEVGAMNMFFKIDGVVKTPALVGSVLHGITRASVITMLRKKGIKVEEGRISIDQIKQAASEGTLEEVFGTGTAAVISPVGLLNIGGQEISINDGKIGELAQSLFDELTGIQNGSQPDEFGWTVHLN